MTEFGDPALERLWRAAQARREGRGPTGDARVALADLSPDEAFAIDGLPWPGRPRPILPGTPFTTTLARLEAAVLAAGGDLSTVLHETVGRPPRDLPAENRAQRARRAEWHERLLDHPVVRTYPGLGAWAAHVVRVGAPGPGDRALVETALQVVGALPRSPPVARSTLSAELLHANPHRLDSRTELCGLCTSLLAWRRGHASAALDPVETRELWLGFGVEVDPFPAPSSPSGLIRMATH